MSERVILQGCWLRRDRGRQRSNSHTLIETFDGSQWTQDQTVIPANSSLNDIACVTESHCVAVGWSSSSSPQVQLPLIETYDAGVWTQQVAPNPSPYDGGPLTGVSCVTTNFCTAVGYTGLNALLELWNGTSWTSVPSPSSVPQSQSMLYGVSCPNSTFCAAVGWTRSLNGSGGVSTLIKTYNGASWSEAAARTSRFLTPMPQLSSVTTLRTFNVLRRSPVLLRGQGPIPTTTGGQTLIEGYDGNSWSIIPSPNPQGSTGSHR